MGSVIRPYTCGASGLSSLQRWTSNFCGRLEAEHAKLKKLVAERDLEIDVMREVAVKNGRRTGASAKVTYQS
jgi:hypothetical protein